MIQTLRRLDEGERYLGLTLAMWAGAAVAAVVLYLGVRFSPLAVKPTITITLFLCAFIAMIIYGVSGQALSPTRQLWAIVTYLTAPKLLALSDKPERRGLVLVAVPALEPDDTAADDLNAAGGNVDESVGVEDPVDADLSNDELEDQADDEDRWVPDNDLAAPEPASSATVDRAVELDSGDLSADQLSGSEVAGEQPVSDGADPVTDATDPPQPAAGPGALAGPADPTVWEDL